MSKIGELEEAVTEKDKVSELTLHTENGRVSMLTEEEEYYRNLASHVNAA
jgi:hypothetical protein